MSTCTLSLWANICDVDIMKRTYGTLSNCLSTCTFLCWVNTFIVNIIVNSTNDTSYCVNTCTHLCWMITSSVLAHFDKIFTIHWKTLLQEGKSKIKPHLWNSNAIKKKKNIEKDVGDPQLRIDCEVCTLRFKPGIVVNYSDSRRDNCISLVRFTCTSVSILTLSINYIFINLVIHFISYLSAKTFYMLT